MKQQHAQSTRRPTFSSALVALAAIAGVGITSAFASGPAYPFPNPESPTNLLNAGDGVGKAMRYINAQFSLLANGTGGLAALNTARLIVPDADGAGPLHVASATEFPEAVKKAFEDKLDGTDDGAGDLADSGFTFAQLVTAAGLWSGAAIPKVATAGAEKINASSALNAAAKEASLEVLTSSLVSVDPKKAPAVVAGILKVIAPKSAATGSPVFPENSDDVVSTAIQGSASLADKGFASTILSAAVGVVKKVAVPAPIVKDIIREGYNATIVNDGGKLLMAKYAEAARKSAAGGTNPLSTAEVVQELYAGLAGTAEDNTDGSLVTVGGVLRASFATGVLATDESVIKATAASSHAASSVQTGIAVDAAVAVSVNGSAFSGAPATFASYITGTPASHNEVAAAVAGAVALYNQSSNDIIKEALIADNAVAGDDTVDQIVEIGVRVNPSKASATVTSVLAGFPAVDKSQFVSGLVKGALIKDAGTLSGKIVKAAVADGAAAVQSVATAALAGASARGKSGAYWEIAKNAMTNSKGLGATYYSTVVPALVMASDANAGPTYAIAASVVAADKKNAVAIKAAIQGASPADLNAANLAADTAIAVQTTSTNFWNIAVGALQAGTTDTDNERLAVLYAVGLQKAANLNALAALTLANGGVSKANVLNAVTQLKRTSARNFELALNAAEYVKANPGEIFDYVDHNSFEYGAAYAADIAIGAAVATPERSHWAMHALAFRQPAKASSVIPSMISYSFRDADNNGDDNIDNRVAATAAIVAGGTCGILESTLAATPTDKRIAPMKAMVAAAVKAALLVQGPAGPTSNPTGSAVTTANEDGPAGVFTGFLSQALTSGTTGAPVGSLIYEVVLAAAKAAKKHGEHVAFAAGQAIGAVVSSGNQAAVASAISSALSAALITNTANVVMTSPQLLAAINLGIAQASLPTLGAGAAGVVNFAHKSCTGNPVTSIFDI